VNAQPQITETSRDDPGAGLGDPRSGEHPDPTARAPHIAPQPQTPGDGAFTPEMLGRGRLFAAISTSIVAIHRQGYGRGPTKAKTYAQDDMIIVVMRDPGYTPLERTMLADGGPEPVAAMRRDFQALIAGRYKQAIGDLTGRDVLATLSQAHVDPDITTEIFFLDRPLDDPQPAQPDAPQTEEPPVSLRDAMRNIPGIAAAEAAITGALASASDLPIADYDQHTATDIASRLKHVSQRELRIIDAYERKHESRSTITEKIAKLTAEEPWSGYDELNVDAITTALHTADPQLAQAVKTYEHARKDRGGVIDSADKRIAA
jgi:uncharacterized protein YbcI